jgi:DNA-binding NtrC family response regulator
VRVVSATNVNLKEAIRAGRFRQDFYYRLQEMTIRLPPLRERDGDIQRIAEHFVRLYAARFRTKVHGVSDAALEMLEQYPWPGNVRELQSAMKSAVVLATDVVLPEHLPPEVRGNGPRAAIESGSPADSGDDEHGCAARGPLGLPVGLGPEGEREPDLEQERLRLEIEVGLKAHEIDLKALGARAAEEAERSLLRALVHRERMSGAQMARLLGVDPKTLRAKLRRYGLEVRHAAEE